MSEKGSRTGTPKGSLKGSKPGTPQGSKTNTPKGTPKGSKSNTPLPDQPADPAALGASNGTSEGEQVLSMQLLKKSKKPLILNIVLTSSSFQEYWFKEYIF